MRKSWFLCLIIALAVTTVWWIHPPTAEAAIVLTVSNIVGVPNSCGALVSPVVTFSVSADATAPDAFPVQFRVQRSSAAGSAMGGLVTRNDNGTINGGASNTGIFGVAPHSLFTFSFIQEGTGITLFAFSIDCTTGAAAVATGDDVVLADGLLPNGDEDNDGVTNRNDNCPRLSNPEQTNDWGGLAGDACDNNFYDNFKGIKLFQTLDGNFNVFACPGGNCIFVAQILVGFLNPANSPMLFQSGNSQGWYLQVYHISTQNGASAYQVNVYAPGGALQEDKIYIVINATSVAWLSDRGSGSQNVVPSDFNPGQTTTFVSTSTTPTVRVNTSTHIPPGFVPYIPNARINPPGFTANPDVRPGDRAIAVGNVAVRIAPDLDAPKTGTTLGWGTLVTVIEEDAGGYWFYVMADNGVEGWVANEWFAKP